MVRKIGAFLIIVILIATLVFVGFLIFNMVKDNGNDEPQVVAEDEKVKPEIVLTQEENENGEIVITVSTSVNDDNGIKEILLPDETKVVAETAKYVVEKNGEYEFKVIANNGQSNSAKIEIDSIVEKSYKNPYIPKGFSVIADDVESGFVIEDGYGNQYVWVPVENGKLTRTNVFDTNYEENSSTATALVNSAAKYYGFYIGRFEASEYEVDGRKTAASMKGKIPWTNINCLDAIDFATSSGEVFGYEDCSTALASSHAWDSVLNWIDTKYEHYSSSFEYGNYDNNMVNPTGTTSTDIVCQICDLAGNVSEWTTEIYKSTTNKSTQDGKNIISRVIRGGSATLNRTPASRRGYAEDLLDAYWGFRLVLYK